MPEKLKDRYTKPYIQALGKALKNQYPPFPEEDFVNAVFDQTWALRELKDRMHHIAVKIHEHLRLDYPESIEVLKRTAPEFTGFEAMIFPDFVETYGLEHWDLSIQALHDFTRFSSSEFAVRAFILKDPERMMAQMLAWSLDGHEHVRRLASEGARPRLPWAVALPDFKRSPTPVLPILENLKQDSSLYVRRSVANHLNDIAKDNPDITLTLVERWQGTHPDTDWIIKHGCRTLLKQGHLRALTLFGWTHTFGVVKKFTLSAHELRIGDTLSFSFELDGGQALLGKTRIDYAVDYVKARGHYGRKIFKLAEKDIRTRQQSFSKAHAFVELSTRRHYPGEHRLTLLVNGQEKHTAHFMLHPATH